jgi:hypothetical protein
MPTLIGPIADASKAHADIQKALGYPRWEQGYRYPEGAPVMVWTEQTDDVRELDGKGCVVAPENLDSLKDEKGAWLTLAATLKAETPGPEWREAKRHEKLVDTEEAARTP